MPADVRRLYGDSDRVRGEDEGGDDAGSDYTQSEDDSESEG